MWGSLCRVSSDTEVIIQSELWNIPYYSKYITIFIGYLEYCQIRQPNAIVCIGKTVCNVLKSGQYDAFAHNNFIFSTFSEPVSQTNVKAQSWTFASKWSLATTYFYSYRMKHLLLLDAGKIANACFFVYGPMNEMNKNKHLLVITTKWCSRLGEKNKISIYLKYKKWSECLGSNKKNCIQMQACVSFFSFKQIPHFSHHLMFVWHFPI